MTESTALERSVIDYTEQIIEPPICLTCMVHNLEKLVGNWKLKTYLFFVQGTYVCKRPFLGDFTRVNRLLEVSKYWA